MIDNITQETDKMSHCSVRCFEINNYNYRPKTEPWERGRGGYGRPENTAAHRCQGFWAKVLFCVVFCRVPICTNNFISLKILSQRHSGSLIAHNPVNETAP